MIGPVRSMKMHMKMDTSPPALITWIVFEEIWSSTSLFEFYNVNIAAGFFPALGLSNTSVPVIVTLGQ